METLDKRKVTTTDDTLRIYQSRDLSSDLIAQVGKGVEVQLDGPMLYDGHEWMQATLRDGTVGYVLGPSARGHTTLEQAIEEAITAILKGERNPPRLAEKRNVPQRLQRVTLGTRIIAGLFLGVVFVIAAMLAYVFLPLILYGWDVLLGNHAADMAQTISQFWVGLERLSRPEAATIFLWMFVGAYVAGFCLSSGKPLPKAEWHATALLCSSLLICGVGCSALYFLGLYWSEIGFAVFAFFMGLVPAVFLYGWLAERVPSLLPWPGDG